MLKYILSTTLGLGILTAHAQDQRADSITANLTEIEFATDRSFYSKGMPTQVGTARRSEPITIPGLYNISQGIPAGYEIDSVNPGIIENGATVGLNLVNSTEPQDTRPFSIYNAGNKLPLFKLGTNWYTYIRTVKDFYNDRNYIWAGDLNIIGEPGNIGIETHSDGWIENDGVDAVIDAEGKMSKIYRFHKDYNFNNLLVSASGGASPNGPTWRYNKITSFNITMSIAGAKIDTTRQAKIRYGIYDKDTASTIYRSIKIVVNDSPKAIYCDYKGRGEKLFSANMDSQYLINADEKININITNINGFENFLDFIEVYVPVLEEGENNDEGYALNAEKTDKVPNFNYYDTEKNAFLLPKRLIVKVDKSYSGPIKINGAIAAISLADQAGSERKLSLSNGEVTSTADNKVIYFCNGPVRGGSHPLNFDQEKELQLIDASQNDYVAIIPENYNYFLQLREEQFPKEDAVSAFTLGPWQRKSFSSNLYQTWLTTEVNGKTIRDIHTSAGLSPLYLKVEDIIDTYGCGLYSPEGIVKFLEESQTIKYVCLASATSCALKKQAHNFIKYSDGSIGDPYHIQTPGVPTGFFYGNQGGISTTDDIYCEGYKQSKMVGRVLAYTDSDLAAWLKRRITYKPSDSISLWAGQNDDDISFTKKQLIHHGKLPSILLDVNELGKETMNRRIMSSVEGGTTTGIYQGHGAIDFICNSTFLKATDSEMTKPACYIWATCNTGMFYLTGYTKELGGYTNIAYHYMCGKPAVIQGSNIDLEGNENIGAVNIIAASNLALASWENQLVGQLINKVNSDKNATWGEMYKYGKQHTSYNESSKVYHFFGDPAMKVRGDSPRFTEVEQSNVFKDKMTVHIEGDWNSRQPHHNELKVKYGKVETDGSTTWIEDLKPINTSLYSDNDLNNGGVDVDIDLSSLPKISNLRVKVYSEHSSGTFVEEFETLWGKSKIFAIDRVVPESEISLPERWSSIIDNRIVCKSSTVIDGYPSTSAGVAGYQFILTWNYTKETNYKEFYSNDANNLLATPDFIFHPSDFPEMAYGDYKLVCRTYDKLGNYSDSIAKKFYWRKNFDETDSNENDIADVWEKFYFGSVEFTNGDQDSNGDGISDRDAYALGLHPYEFTMNLQPGWNLLSFPCQIDDEKLTEIVQNIDSIWAYDAQNQLYAVVDSSDLDSFKSSLGPLTGFWAFCTQVEPEQITYTGIAPSPTITVSHQWNLIGPAASYIYTAQQTMNSAHDWNNTSFDYDAVNNGEKLLPSNGYWIYSDATSDKQITVK